MAMCSTGIRLLASVCCSLVVSAAYCHTAPSLQYEALTAELGSTSANHQTVYIQRGLLFLNDKEFAHALSDLRQAEQLGPAVNVAHVLGLYYFRQQHPAEALRYFETYLEYFPKHLASLQYRAKALHELGQMSKAIESYRIYIRRRVQPSAADYLFLSRLYQASSKLSTQAPESNDAALNNSLQVLDEGMESLGVNPLLQKEAVALLMSRGQYQKALERHSSLAFILAATPRWLTEQADLLMLLGKRAQGEEQYRLACDRLRSLKSTPARVRLQEELAGRCQSGNLN